MMGRVTLVRFVLSFLLVYLLSNTWMPKMYLLKLEQLLRQILWRSYQEGWEVYLLAWKVFCQPMRDGGLRIQSLMVRWEALIIKHATRFLLCLDGLWSSLMMVKYGSWMIDNINPLWSSSFMWREICARAVGVL